MGEWIGIVIGVAAVIVIGLLLWPLVSDFVIGVVESWSWTF